MQIDPAKLNELFSGALELSPEARESYLAQACQDNLELRQQVDSLLQSYENSGSFLHKPLVHPPPIPIAEVPGTVIGRYKLLEQIGEGGFGQVFMAEQLDPVRRMVALKIIKPGMDTREVIARFEAERQALALMDHPNVARVLDGGSTGTGRPYFVMDLVKGIPITEFCDQNQLSPKPRLKLFLQVCAGVQHAHQKGIIHRDIKPTNVLVTVQDGVPTAKVIDFGVAKALGQKLTERTLFTRFSQLIGTPAYMSPEQAEWGARDVDTRSDIYSLGALLYELLTGTTPLEKDTIARAALDEVWRMVRETDPPRPSLRIQGLGQKLNDIAGKRQIEPRILARFVRGDLDWIVMKSLEKDRARRYSTANALASEVERYLAGEAVVARPPSTAYRAGKFMRRNRAAVTASAIGLIALVLLTVGAFLWQARQTRQARQLAEENRRQVVRFEVAGGQERLQENDAAGSLLWFAEALGNVSGDAAREKVHRIRLASILDQCPKLLRMFTNSEAFRFCSFSPNGSNILALSDHGLKVFDVSSGTVLFAISLRQEAYRYALPAWTAGGQRIVVRSMELGFRPEVYSGTDGHEIALPPSSGQGNRRLLDSCDGRAGLVAEDDFTARLCDLESGAPLSPLVTVREKIVSGRLAADHEHFALVAGEALHLQVWDAQTAGRVGGEMVIKRDGAFVLSQDAARVCIRQGLDMGGDPEGWAALEMFEAATGKPVGFPLNAVKFSVIPSSDGFPWLRAKSGRDDWLFWNFDTGEQFQLSSKVLPYRFLAFHPDGLLLATVTDAGKAFMVSRLTGEKVMPEMHHAKWALGVAFSPDGRLLASCSEDRTLRFWDLAGARPSDFTLRHGDAVSGLAVSPEGGRLATIAPNVDGPRIWDTVTGRPSNEPFDHSAATEVSFSKNGKRVLAFDSSTPKPFASTGFFLKQTDDARTLRWLVLDESLCRAEFTPDGDHVMTAPCGRGPFRLWDVATDDVVASFNDDGIGLGFFAVSQDGKRLATLRDSGSVRLWDMTTGKCVGELAGSFQSVELSPDGSLLATGGRDQCAVVWALPSLKPVTPALFVGGTPVQEKFSPDGKLLLARGHNSGLKLWEIETGRLLFTLPNGWLISHFEFSRDGKYVLSAGDDSRVCDTTTGELVTILPRHFGQVLDQTSAPRHLGRVLDARFSPEGNRIFTAGTDGAVRAWKLTRTEYPVKDVKELAELLASSTLDPTGNFMPLSAEELLARYEGSRSKHPEMFQASSPRQRALWHDQISEIAAMSNQWRTVIWHLDRALEVDPSLAETPTADELFARRGRARAETGNLSGALSDYQRAVQLEPSKLRHWYTFAWLSAANGSHDQYISVCAQALKEFSQRCARTNLLAIECQNNLACLCLFAPNSTDNIRLAGELLERARAAASSNAYPYKELWGYLDGNLGEVLYREGRYAEAMEQLKRSCDAQASGGGFEDFIYLSMAHSRLGRYDEANRFFTKASGLVPNVGDWQDRVIGKMLREEAQRLLTERK